MLLHKVADEEAAVAAARSGAAAMNPELMLASVREGGTDTRLMFLRQELRKNLRSVRIWLWHRTDRWLLPGVKKKPVSGA